MKSIAAIKDKELSVQIADFLSQSNRFLKHQIGLFNSYKDPNGKETQSRSGGFNIAINKHIAKVYGKNAQIWMSLNLRLYQSLNFMQES